MAKLGLQDYGDIYYLGTAPLRGEYPLRDVLVATAGDIESRFYFHPESGQLEVVECSSGRYSDPAELLIEWNASKPVGLALHYGVDRHSRMRVQKWSESIE